jgi:succinate dehydrogenase / fumarate reductase flavoprotein subunit
VAAVPNKDYILLKLDHLGADTIHKRLPSVYEIGVNFANVDITKEPIPVVPTIHYQMGGIPTNINGQVVTPKATAPTTRSGQRPVRRGRMLLRERARRQPPGHQLAAGPAGVRPRRRQPHRRVQQQEQATSRCPSRRGRPHAGAPEPLDNSTSGEYAQDVANDIRATMQQHAGVFRTQASMDEGVVKKIADLRERVASVTLKDKSKVFNTARIEALEVDNLIEVAQATMVSAAARKECRGAHTVYDYEHPPTTPSSRWAATTPTG